MKNIGLIKLEKANIDNFTSLTGLKIRRIINKPVRFILKKATKGNIIVEDYPKLEKNKPYIFAATHSFVEEISATLASIDRSAYTLCGTTDQFENNPRMYFNWLTGIIFVDRYDEESRKSSIPKMEKVLQNGSSILIFPEGGLNNTENLLVMKLFSGPYTLSKNTLPLYKYDKKEALILLRDALATMQYNQMEKHASRIKREELPKDPRLHFMEERRQVYRKTRWTRDVWDEELTVFRGEGPPTPEEVRESIDNINVNASNAGILGPVLVRRLEDQTYDFRRYMHATWNK